MRRKRERETLRFFRVRAVSLLLLYIFWDARLDIASATPAVLKWLNFRGASFDRVSVLLKKKELKVLIFIIFFLR